MIFGLRSDNIVARKVDLPLPLSYFRFFFYEYLPTVLENIYM